MIKKLNIFDGKEKKIQNLKDDEKLDIYEVNLILLTIKKF
jgi:hypothetical protein